jgi:uncharacterized protein (DUF58 family)
MAELLHNSAIENLELIARQVVEGFIIGLHKSPFHGFSVEFAEHRLYNVGDNLRHVDWKVFARNDRMFVKKFEEETNLRCCVAIDTSASMFYPQDAAMNKLQYSCIAAACLFELLKRQLDASSLALFDEDLYELTAARSGQRHNRMLTTQLEQLLSKPVAQKKTNATAALHQIADRLHQRSLVILFSDMADTPENPEAFYAALQHLRYNKHEVILFHVGDGSHEWSFDFENRPYEFVDMENGAILKLNPADIREEYMRRITAYRQELESRCHQYRIDLVNCDIKEPVEQVLYRYLLKRNKMM